MASWSHLSVILIFVQVFFIIITIFFFFFFFFFSKLFFFLEKFPHPSPPHKPPPPPPPPTHTHTFFSDLSMKTCCGPYWKNLYETLLRSTYDTCIARIFFFRVFFSSFLLILLNSLLLHENKCHGRILTLSRNDLSKRISWDRVVDFTCTVIYIFITLRRTGLHTWAVDFQISMSKHIHALLYCY